DFFAIFSSLVSVTGGAGQVDYSAASNFQDAFVQAAPSDLARRVVSINWGAWRETGMALRAAVQRGARAEDALPDGMSNDEGVDAFLRALASPHPQVLVAPQPLRILAQTMPADALERTAPHLRWPAGTVSPADV